jgi:quercetin dioxygenase-like cupin family protein
MTRFVVSFQQVSHRSEHTFATMASDVVENPVTGERMTILDTAESTGDKRTRSLVEVVPGGGVPTHYHGSYNERIEAKEGIVDVGVRGEHRRLKPDEAVVMEPGQAHRFYDACDERMVMLAESKPANEGWELMLRSMSGLAREV